MQNNNSWPEELKLIASILEKANLEKAIKWGADVYTYNNQNVVSYGGFKNYCTIWFYNGVFLDDKYKVLINAQEGKTKSLRQWRFYSISEIDENKILEYVNEAIEIEKKGLKMAPQKIQKLSLPPEIANLIKTHADIEQAFYQLSQGKQNEYIIYINEAKQETTKHKRIEKITPMILAGVGINDKYKK